LARIDAHEPDRVLRVSPDGLGIESELRYTERLTCLNLCLYDWAATVTPDKAVLEPEIHISRVVVEFVKHHSHTSKRRRRKCHITRTNANLMAALSFYVNVEHRMENTYGIVFEKEALYSRMGTLIQTKIAQHQTVKGQNGRVLAPRKQPIESVAYLARSCHLATRFADVPEQDHSLCLELEMQPNSPGDISGCLPNIQRKTAVWGNN